MEFVKIKKSILWNKKSSKTQTHIHTFHSCSLDNKQNIQIKYSKKRYTRRYLFYKNKLYKNI